MRWMTPRPGSNCISAVGFDSDEGLILTFAQSGHTYAYPSAGMSDAGPGHRPRNRLIKKVVQAAVQWILK